MSSVSSTIIQDIETIYDTGRALIGYLYFDFWDVNEQHWRHIVPSLITQLSSRSGPHFDILSRLYSDHDSGARQPSDNVLTKCLKEILTPSDQWPIYLIIDAVDECPNTSGILSPREMVLHFVNDFVDLRLPNLHTYVSQAGRKSTYEASLTLSLLIRCCFITKVDKRRISRTMFGLLSTHRIRSRS